MIDRHVLVVDDNPYVLRLILRELEGSVLAVPATGWADALAFLDTAVPWAVVSDLDLGGDDDGIALLAEVRRRAPRCRRVLISGSASAEDHARVTRAMTAGTVHEFLAKPWPRGALVGALLEFTLPSAVL